MVQKIINDFRQMQQSFHKTCEVKLFRNLANSITNNSNSVFIDETHGNICQVNFTSVTGKLTTCEIADLLIISISNSGSIRATFWQAKKNTISKRLLTRIQGRFHFRGQVNQWDLLSRRPKIYGVRKFNPPPTLLSSFNSYSIGSFGIFYERNSLIEINHSIARFIFCNNIKAKNSNMTIYNYLAYFNYNYSEIIVRSTLHGFLTALFSHQIGALLDGTKTEHKWLVSYAKSKVEHAFGNNISIDEFDQFLRESPPRDFEMGNPSDGLSILIVREQDVPPL